MGYHFSYHFELRSLSFVLERPTNEHVRNIHLPDLQQLDALHAQDVCLATKSVTKQSQQANTKRSSIQEHVKNESHIFDELQLIDHC